MTTHQDQEREAFERAREAGAFNHCLPCCPTWYASVLRLEGWQARAALAQQAPLPELSDEVFDVLSMARMVLFQYHKLYRLDSEQRLIDRIDAALAAKKGGA